MWEEKMASPKIIVYLNCSRNSKWARVARISKVKSSGKWPKRGGRDWGWSRGLVGHCNEFSMPLLLLLFKPYQPSTTHFGCLLKLLVFYPSALIQSLPSWVSQSCCGCPALLIYLWMFSPFWFSQETPAKKGSCIMHHWNPNISSTVSKIYGWEEVFS